MSSIESFWSFAKTADTAAQDKHTKHWRLFADDYLSALVSDYWCGRLDPVFRGPPGVRNKPDIITREVVWRGLGPAKPLAFRDTPEGKLPILKDLAQAKPEDYWPSLRSTILAQLLLPSDDAHNWIARQGTPPRPVGRPIQHDWDMFWREVVRIANTYDGLPDKQVDIEKAMIEWCESNWSKHPVESTVRDKLSRLDKYN